MKKLGMRIRRVEEKKTFVSNKTHGAGIRTRPSEPDYRPRIISRFPCSEAFDDRQR